MEDKNGMEEKSKDKAESDSIELSLPKAGEKTQTAIAILIIVALSLLFVSPIFANLNYWNGNLDWDTAVMAHAVVRKTIAEFKQFPFWDPYTCGGNLLFAHPNYDHNSAFSVLDLAFGELIGIKLKIATMLIIGSIGAFFLARHFGAAIPYSVAASVLFLFNSMYSQTMMAGQTWRFALAYVPWIFLFFLKAEQQAKFAIVTGILLSLTIFEGVSYIFPITVLMLFVYSLLYGIFRRNWKLAKIFLIVIAIGCGIAAVRMLPMYEFFSKYPRELGFDKNDHNSLYELLNTFTNAEHLKDGWSQDFRLLQNKELWYEYSYYIGWIGLVLVILAFAFTFKQNKELVITALIFLSIMLGTGVYMPTWRLLHMLPIYGSEHIVTRYGMIFMLLAGVAVAKFLTMLSNSKLKISGIAISKQQMKIASLIILIVLIGNMLYVNYKPFKKAFLFAPYPANDSNPEFYMVGNYHGFNWNFNMYRYFVVNKGMKECNVQPLIPFARAENGSLLRPEQEMKVQPKYFVIEYIRLLSNANQKPVFFFHDGQLKTPWLVGDEIQALLNNKWYRSEVNVGDQSNSENSSSADSTWREATMQMFMQDVDGRFSNIFPWGVNTKFVLPSRTVKRIEISIENRTAGVYDRKMNYEIAKATKFDGRTFVQDNRLFISIGQLVFMTDIDTSYGSGKSANIIMYESSEDIEKIPNPDYRGEAYLLNENGKAEIIKWTPNKLELSLDVEQNDILLINQHYFEGWRIKKSNKADNKVEHALNYKGLIGTKVGPEDKKLEIYYYPTTFNAGLIVSIIFLIIAVVLFKKSELLDKLFGFSFRRKAGEKATETKAIEATTAQTKTEKADEGKSEADSDTDN